MIFRGRSTGRTVVRTRAGVLVGLITAAVALTAAPGALACIATGFSASSPGGPGDPLQYSFGSKGSGGSDFTVSVDGQAVATGRLEPGGSVSGSVPMPDLGSSDRDVTVAVVTDDPDPENRPLTVTVHYTAPPQSPAPASEDSTPAEAPAPTTSESAPAASAPAPAPAPAGSEPSEPVAAAPGAENQVRPPVAVPVRVRHPSARRSPRRAVPRRVAAAKLTRERRPAPAVPDAVQAVPAHAPAPAPGPARPAPMQRVPGTTAKPRAQAPITVASVSGVTVAAFARIPRPTPPPQRPTIFGVLPDPVRLARRRFWLRRRRHDQPLPCERRRHSVKTGAGRARSHRAPAPAPSAGRATNSS